MSDKTIGRKIALPEYCCPSDHTISGGRDDCDHDYPPESLVEHCEYLTWTCSRCGLVISFGVYQ